MVVIMAYYLKVMVSDSDDNGLLPIRPKHGDRSQARCLRNNETSPAGANVEQVANHCEGRHLGSGS